MCNPLNDALIAPHRGRGTPFLHALDAGYVNHADFVDLAGPYASGLRARGVAPGVRVAVHVQKRFDALTLYAGCLQAGADLPANQHRSYAKRT